MLAAAWMHVAPWELAARPLRWQRMALICRELEGYDPESARSSTAESDAG